ncbi:hypothetical protein HYH02_002002 [Chlamydomonas schloesseri]|uniref:Uncharacterized protein n=1 Tax=Chlamydomonas schloesseri TaxID=2026947 RepID=A0A835WT94_9CHLO|nr:hypothetical protein HYH02_002002 [Chlamydomonas schloesseri]|eukprot:KAG2453793.1 hypothetical protein HYH02_002002 [Chlamydomonas schloesseri]
MVAGRALLAIKSPQMPLHNVMNGPGAEVLYTFNVPGDVLQAYVPPGYTPVPADPPGAIRTSMAAMRYDSSNVDGKDEGESKSVIWLVPIYVNSVRFRNAMLDAGLPAELRGNITITIDEIPEKAFSIPGTCATQRLLG